MNGLDLNFTFNPVLNVQKLNAILSEVKNSLGKLGDGIKPIDEKKFEDSLKKIETQAVNTGKALGDNLNKASGDAGKKISDNVGKGLSELPKKADAPINQLQGKLSNLGSNVQNIFSSALGVFGGGMLLNGFSGIVTGFQDIMNAGMEATEDIHAMEMAFSQAGLAGQELNKAVAQTNDYIGQLQEKYAMADDELERYSQLAASVGGATGKANQDLVQLAIGIEKASGGMVDGTAAIKLFSRGITDPESQFALGRLTKAFPALATELKGLKNPAEATQKALAFFGPTFSKMEEAAGGPLGASQKMANAMKNLREGVGVVLVNAFYPLVNFMGSKILPALSGAATAFGSMTKYIKPLTPLLVGAGIALVGVAGTLATIKGIQAFSGLVGQASQFAMSIVQKVVPALILQDATTKRLIINKQALSLATLKETAQNWLNVVAQGAYNVAKGIGVAVTTAFNAVLAMSPIGWIITAIGLLIGSFVLLYKHVDSFAKFFDKVWVGIKAVVMAYWEYIKGIFTAVYKLFTGDFSGAWKAVSGIGKNMASAFGATWKEGMDKVDWEYASKKMDESLKKAKEIKVSIKAEENNANLLEWYTYAQGELNKLQLKQEAGIALSPEEQQSFAKLSKDAQYMATQLGKIAPAAKENFRVVVDANGQLKEVWDININKAKEYLKAGGNQGELKKAAQEYSGALSEQARIIANKTEWQKKLQNEINKETDPKVKEQLIKSYNETNTAIKKNRDEMIKSFREGGAAGLVTEDAIKKVAKAIGTTSEEAKKMLVADALKQAGADGETTAAEIEKIAKQFGISTEKVKAMVVEQKKLTEELKASARAALSLSDAVNEAQKLQNEGRSELIMAKALLNAKQISQDEYNKRVAAANQKIKEGAALQKEYNAAAKEVVKTGIDELYVADETGRKEKEKANTKSASAKEVTSEYQKQKKIIEESEGLSKQERENAQKELEIQRLKSGIVLSQLDQDRESLKNANDLLTVAEKEYKSRLKLLEIAQKTYDAEKNKGKIGEKTKQDLAEATSQVNEFASALKDATKNKIEIELKIRTDEQQIREEIDKIDFEMAKAELEYYVSIGLAPNSALTQKTLDGLKKDLDKAKKQLDLSRPGIAISFDEKKFKESMAKVQELQRQINVTQKKLNTELSNEKIMTIENEAERNYQLAIQKAKETYDEDLKLAKNNEDLKNKALIKYQTARIEAENLLSKKSFNYFTDLWKSAVVTYGNAIATALSSFTITTNNTALQDAIKKIDSEESALKKSLAARETSYEKYIESLMKLDDKRAEAGGAKQTQWYNQMLDNLAKSLAESSKALKTTLANDAKVFTENQLAQFDATQKLNELKQKLGEDETKWKEEDKAKKAKLEADTISMQNQAEKAKQDAYLGTSMLFANTLITMGIQQKNWAKASVYASIEALRALVPIFVVQIMGSELSKLSFGGLVTAGILTGALYAVLATAEAAVAKMKLYKGKVNIQGPGTETSDSIPADISKGESVITARGTRQNVKELTYINRTNKSVMQYYIDHEPDRLKQAYLTLLQGDKSKYFVDAKGILKINNQDDVKKALYSITEAREALKFAPAINVLINEKYAKENNTELKALRISNERMYVELKEMRKDIQKGNYSRREYQQVDVNLEFNDAELLTRADSRKLASLRRS